MTSYFYNVILYTLVAWPVRLPSRTYDVIESRYNNRYNSNDVITMSLTSINNKERRHCFIIYRRISIRCLLVSCFTV